MGTRVKLRVMEDGAASGGEKQPLMQSFMVTDQLAFPDESVTRFRTIVVPGIAS